MAGDESDWRALNDEELNKLHDELVAELRQRGAAPEMIVDATDGELSTMFDTLVDEFAVRGYDCRASENPVGAFRGSREYFAARRDQRPPTRPYADAVIPGGS